MAGAGRAELITNGALRRVDSTLRRILGPRYPKRLPARVLVAGADPEFVANFLESTLGSERLVVDDNPSDRDLRREHQQPGGFDVIIALSTPGDLPDPDWVTRLRRWLDALTVEGGVLLLTSTRAPGSIGRTLDQLTGGLARWRHMPAAGLYPAASDLWLITLDPAFRIHVDVDDLASPTNGSRHVLYAGSLEATELLLQLRHQRQIADHYRNQVEIFEASRWGKLRRAWMALKSRLP